MNDFKHLPDNVSRLLANKITIDDAMRKYTVALRIPQEVAYQMVIEEVSEWLAPQDRPWKPYKDFASFKSATNRVKLVEHKNKKRKKT